jgi:uncharacterized membrane protein YtjA (UPF0391 family)
LWPRIGFLVLKDIGVRTVVFNHRDLSDEGVVGITIWANEPGESRPTAKILYVFAVVIVLMSLFVPLYVLGVEHDWKRNCF